MDVKKVNLYLEQYGSYYKTEQLTVLREALLSVPDKYADEVLSTKLLNPTYMQIVSASGGVLGWDRFLLGDKTMGFVKMFLLGGCGIVALIDLFTIQNKTKDNNYDRMTKCIASVGNPAMRPQAPVVPAPVNPMNAQQSHAPAYAPQPVVARQPVAPAAPVVPVAPAVVPPVAPVAPVVPPVAAPVAPKAPVAVATAPAPISKSAEPAAPAEPKAPEAPTMAPTPPKKR